MAAGTGNCRENNDNTDDTCNSDPGTKDWPPPSPLCVGAKHRRETSPDPFLLAQ